jgi:hypothetical protein
VTTISDYPSQPSTEDSNFSVEFTSDMTQEDIEGLTATTGAGKADKNPAGRNPLQSKSLRLVRITLLFFLLLIRSSYDRNFLKKRRSD